MEYTEGNQNSAPGNVEATKVNNSRQAPESHNVTKR